MELLSREHRVGGLDISGHGPADKLAREAALEGKIAEHDPGFLGVVGEGVRSSTVIHSMEQLFAPPTRDIYADAAEYEDGYEWRADADKYER
jgi:hypothetical protein